jgi:multiple sugar transport system ATP-binding protein
MALADQITVMSQGKIMQVGRPMEIYEQPANLFVAGFLGSPPMNLLEGEWSDGVFRAPGVTIPLNGSAEIVNKAASGHEIILGMRPEDVHIAAAGDDEGAVRGEVYTIEPLGDETLLDIKLGEALVRARVGPAEPWREGDVVSVTFDDSRVHIFDAETEEALK